MEANWGNIVARHKTALLGVLAGIVAMAGVLAGDKPTLPRHLYRTVLALMRPLESAIRRLMIVAARDVVVKPYPPKPAPPPQFPPVIAPFSHRYGVVHTPVRSLGIAAWNQPPKPKRPAPSTYSIPVADPLPVFGKKRRKRVPAHLGPRISFFNGNDPPRPKAPPKPTRDDPMDARRIVLRLEAYARALNDLPRQAKRVARWKARRAAGYIRRLSPIRSGPAWGSRKKYSRRPQHEIDDVLLQLHRHADWSEDARSRLDTS